MAIFFGYIQSHDAYKAVCSMLIW